MSNDGYQILIDKLEEFIKKYYKNKMIRGLIYGLGLILGFYLLVIFLEYIGEFGTGMRTFLFWSFVLSAGFVIGKFILFPLFKLLNLGKTISHEQASKIIGDHFPKVKDKLLNTLQLKELADDGASNSLVTASINQKIGELKPVPFKSAIDFRENRKYLKWVIPPLSIFLIMLFAAPSVLKDSTDRLVRHGQHIEKLAPYHIEVLNKDLSVIQNDDFEVVIKLSGEEIPDKVYVVDNGQQFRLEKGENDLHFGHVFHHVKDSKTFAFYANGFTSKDYELKAIPAPSLLNFDVDVNYPAYTGFKDELLSNTGDVLVPEGTVLTWDFQTENTKEMSVRFADSLYSVETKADNSFAFSKRARRNQNYALHVANDFIQNRDSIVYQIQVIPDNHPQITMNEEVDTILKKHHYFTGEIKDDYGFRRLAFHYTISGDGKQNESNTIELNFNKNAQQDQYYYHWNLEEFDLGPGDKINYYFEVWDNDGINGSKSTRTQIKQVKLPSLDELKDQRDEQSEDLKKDMEESLKDAKDLQKELEDLKKEMLQKEELNWQDKKKLEELLKKQKDLQNNVENIQKQNEEKNKKQSEISQENERLMEKQQKIQELFEELMTKEMKQVYEEMEKLMEEFKMDEIQEQLDEMEMSNEDLEKELDRALEQFKQLEFEQKMEETKEKLAELAKKQEELAEKTEEKTENQEDLKKEQEEINEEFEELMEEMDDLEKMNEELEDPNAMPEFSEEEESVKEDQQESKEQLEKSKNSKASESQQSAAETMKEMAQQMEMMMEQEQEESAEEDMEALRALLENIITLSFDQESLMANMKVVDKKDPLYVSYGQVQRKLKDDSKMVEDSLFALSKRIVQLEAFVNKEIGLVNEHMGEALEEYGERQTPKIITNQQLVMTSFNNLALMLDEALKQMQEDQADKQPGSGSCNNPGGKGKPSPKPSDMKGKQQGLSQQLEQMKKKLENFNKGENKGRGMGEMGQEMMQMAAKQRAIRQAMEEMGNKLNEDGSGNGNEMKEIAKEMEETEKDIVNNKIDQQTLDRQSEILSRLLKAENAEREREMDEKRKSTEAHEQKYSNPEKYSEFEKQKEKEVELLRTLPPSLKPYYKEKVNKYFNKLGGEN